MNVNDGEASKLREEARKLMDCANALEVAETNASNAALVGRAFKYRNCYSCPESESDYWSLYQLVLSANDGCLQVLRFERDKYGKAEATKDVTSGYTLGEEITLDEFAKARDEFAAYVSEMLRARGAQ